MLKSHEKFHSANGKRQLLVVDDEEINREILGLALEEDYEVLYAADGQEALDLIRLHCETLSIVLLDLMMPRVPGTEVLKRLREDPATAQIPVMVVTADQTAEIESLDLGAIDFIPKPFPQAGIIQARIRRIIELSEDRQIIQSTERDPITGLYNREFFYRYAEQYDQHHKNQDMDAIVLNVNHFHIINERYGKAMADDVLRRIGEKIREMVFDEGGIVCRREADTFLLYCPHREDYRAILENASVSMTGAEDADARIRLRMGVYSRADKTIDVERRFDRAKLAADNVRSSFTKNIGIYDNNLHEQELYIEQLVEDFPAAIREKQFVVYYQPKFDIRPETPVLTSAEALVRWKHPRLGMISPGVFIPLFEENGLISQLDTYVWRETARQIREWKDKLGCTVPVSINVSRVDMYDSRLIPTLAGILEENRITPRDLLLEITESAYTEDFEQIIETVNQLRAMGFRVEMDDFGTGYSSLNMISALPIDALKLDMQFIRNAFKAERDTRMLEVIIDIADYLAVPVIAEGVETEEQLHALKAMGCDMVQGYYFSKPVPAEEYAPFLVARKDQPDPVIPEKVPRVPSPGLRREEDMSISRIALALSGGFESIYYVDVESGRYLEFISQGKYQDLQIQSSGADFFADTQENLKRVICPADHLRVSLAMEKETLLSQLPGDQPFTMSYRLMIEGTPVYYTLKAVRAKTHDDHHLVIGVINMDRAFSEVLSSAALTGCSRELSGIAQALTSDFDRVYYVNLDSDRYTKLTGCSSDAGLEIKASGADFFRDFHDSLSRFLHPEDEGPTLEAMEKPRLLEALEQGRPFLCDCRLQTEGAYSWNRLKAAKIESENGRYLVIGMSNIQLQVNRRQEMKAAGKDSVTFSSIAQALAADYLSLYYVNLDNDGFVEYNARDEYLSLHLEESGRDFFNQARKDILKVVYPEDQAKILRVFTKDNILRELEEHRTFSLNYRLVFHGVPTYVSLKASRMEGADGDHIVIGVQNVDAQMKMEQTYMKEQANAQQLAMRDVLTGVKSTYAFLEAEQEMDSLIARGEAPAFAVAVCDVNRLKRINETEGYTAGDDYLKSACRTICTVFKHSPVFRIGGDEFAAILQGKDYENREALAGTFEERDRANMEAGEPVIAFGISAFSAGKDSVFRQVFARADRAMYLNKKLWEDA